LKNLGLLGEAIANENDEWGNTLEEWEVHLEILVAGGAVKEYLPRQAVPEDWTREESIVRLMNG
ncbi:6004_t:CDS:2, partial [Entrophospora sp. SA101]